jgi:hypothetical protein
VISLAMASANPDLVLRPCTNHRAERHQLTA